MVGRQWDAVSHFKAQILQKSTTHLKSAKETDLVSLRANSFLTYFIPPEKAALTNS